MCVCWFLINYLWYCRPSLGAIKLNNGRPINDRCGCISTLLVFSKKFREIGIIFLKFFESVVLLASDLLQRSDVPVMDPRNVYSVRVGGLCEEMQK